MAQARRGLWALPMLLSALFVAGELLWAQRIDRTDREELHRTLISDALSAEAQLRGRLDVEAAHLRVLADQLRAAPRPATATLASHPEVVAGFRRLWLSVTWLDEQNRIVAHVPEALPARLNPAGTFDTGLDDAQEGLSSHLVAPLFPGAGAPTLPEASGLDRPGERLVVRYSPGLLLKRGVPWWLSRKYSVRLIDNSDQVIATLDDAAARRAPATESYRVAVGSAMPGAFLELTPRAAPPPWWHALPLGLILGFLALLTGATWLLRRQVQQVSRAEAAWRTELAWRGAMEDSALVALRARDAEGRLLYVNRTFCEMVGLPAETLIGLVPPMPYWPPDSMEEAMLRSRRNLAGLAPREGYEARWRHQDGRILEVMIFESPLVNAVGQQIGWMGSIIDITERKRLEERERRQTETLAHQARLTTLGEVASALAHQLNQPLTAITGYNAGALRMLERAGYADEMVLKALRRLGEQAHEAGRIVRRIREFLTRRAPQRERCALPELAQHAVALLGRDLKRLQIELSWALESALPEVDADPVLIEQVLINLVRNALDELGQAANAALPRQICVAASRAGLAFVRVDVHDSGPGLSGQGIEALSTAFYSTKPDGMGMGLAICRSIIEAHHGGLDAGASALLGGACFSFTLPLHQAEPTASTDPAAPDAAPNLAPHAASSP